MVESKTMPPSTEAFFETQRLPIRRAAIALSVPPCAMVGLLIWQVILGHHWGKYSISNGNIIGWTVFLWIVYFRLITVRLVTDVRNRELTVALRGLWRSRRVHGGDITSVEVITVNPEREYGGFGIRPFRGGTAYIASGNQGVRVQLAGGSQLIISSQRAKALADVLRRIGKAA
jgi:hypothetical protein